MKTAIASLLSMKQRSMTFALKMETEEKKNEIMQSRVATGLQCEECAPDFFFLDAGNPLRSAINSMKCSWRGTEWTITSAKWTAIGSAVG